VVDVDNVVADVDIELLEDNQQSGGCMVLLDSHNIVEQFGFDMVLNSSHD